MNVIALVFLAFLLPLEAAVPQVTLWAVGDAERVNPVTGSLLIQDRIQIHKDYPRGDFRNWNLTWNGSTKNVTLKAARNEFVAFQVILEASQPVTESM